MIASGSLDLMVLDETVDGVRRIGGIVFHAKRRAKWTIPALLGPARDFLTGLELAMEHYSSPSALEIAQDHAIKISAGRIPSWFYEIKRRIAAGRGTTIETVVMLRESIPFLDRQMELCTVMWPRLIPTADFERRRPGVQTAERLATQAARRAS